jgi:hypothetical protein
MILYGLFRIAKIAIGCTQIVVAQGHILVLLAKEGVKSVFDSSELAPRSTCFY